MCVRLRATEVKRNEEEKDEEESISWWLNSKVLLGEPMNLDKLIAPIKHGPRDFPIFDET